MVKQMSIFDPPEREQRLTQAMKVLHYMIVYGSITPADAMKEFGVMRLAARINDLEKQGFEIVHERTSGKNRFGETVSYSKYSLKSAVTST